MPLQFETPTTATSTEPRYEAETLRKVTALAQRLQARQQETLTAAEIEQIGVEVGLDPSFIRVALQQVTASEATADRSGLKTPSRETRVTAAVQGEFLGRPRLRRMLSAVTASWWAAGWTIPLFGIPAMAHGVQSPFFAAWGMYLGVGVFLSVMLGNDRQERRPGRREAQLEAPPGALHSRTALLESVIALQAQLDRQKQHRAVLCMEVDDVSALKRGATELAVEYSFGQLAAFVREAAQARGGTVHSNSGDRFTVTFSDDRNAVRAARELEEALPYLNRMRNQLNRPFSLRYGLSAGEVATDPQALLHSSVLNRAAALRDTATPGEIILSSELAAPGLLELGHLEPMEEAVPGGHAFSWKSSKVEG